MVKFSIIIPTHNNLQFLIPCLEAVKNTAKLPHEIIVVSNACTDNTASIVKSLGHTLVEADKNLGFSAACNLGAKSATGDFLIFLNDDTLPGTLWLIRLYNCYQNFNKQYPMEAPIGAVGPVSNAVCGRQSIRFNDMPLNPNTIEQTVQRLNAGRWSATGFLSGFCFFISKKLFEEVGGFDTEFFAGCEDNALTLQLQLRGYSCAIAQDSYVFHHMSKTIDRPEFQYLKRGTKDMVKFFDKFRIRGQQKMAALYRAKVVDEFFADIFDKSLARAAIFADGIFVLDDGSPYNIQPLLDKYKDKIVRYERFDRELGEVRDRSTLYKWAKEAGYDWVFSIDSDEVVEDKFDRAYAERVMHPYAPEMFNYWVHFYTFWDSFTNYRTDDVWAQMAGPRIGRVLDNVDVGVAPSIDFHNGNIPIHPPENTGMSSIRIKHYGYVRKEDRQRKYEWYTKTDPKPDPRLVGHPNYKHLIAEDGIQVSTWHEDNTLGIASIMKNEESLLPNFLKQVLPFMDEICLVDTGSTDNSIAIAEAAGCKVLKGPKEENFSKWRNTALQASTCTWGIHLDIDESFEDLIAVRRCTEALANDGFVFYVKNFMPDGRYTISETIRLMQKPQTWYYTGYVHETSDECLEARHKLIARAPFSVLHYGYFRSRVPEKFKKYVKLNRKQMHDFPKDARPVFNLAMHYLEEPGYYDQGVELLKKAIELNPKFYSPRKELILVKLREATEDAQILQQILPQDHMFYNLAQEITETLARWVQPQRRLAPGHVDEAIAQEAVDRKVQEVRAREGGNGQEVKSAGNRSGDEVLREKGDIRHPGAKAPEGDAKAASG